MRLHLKAPAKVNLFLRITGKRADGYHDIFSLMQAVSLYDEITVDVSSGDSISVRVSGNSEVPDGEGNICHKAALGVLTAAGVKRSVEIDITKHIPAGGGLGGGSSDAGAVITALNEALGHALTPKALARIALECGSDVPFFLLGAPAIARGRGELLEQVVLPTYHYVLLNPGFSVSTAEVYAKVSESLDSFGLTKQAEDNILIRLRELKDTPSKIPAILENDLEGVVLDKYRQIEELKESLTDAGADGVLMSGSGATVFGIFSDKAKALDAAAALKAELPEAALVIAVDGL
jgi:4-diphosphocytidyl-2-C-methyl-D-erythritol kinase